jgi:hypothetical protein
MPRPSPSPAKTSVLKNFALPPLFLLGVVEARTVRIRDEDNAAFDGEDPAASSHA